MKKSLLVAVTILIINFSYAQSDIEGVKKACLNYLEGFYEGDTTKLVAALQPSLNKFGFWKNKETSNYNQVDYMSFYQAKQFALNVLEKKRFAKADSPKEVVVLDVMNTIASAKVTAYWGTDYILLSKRGNKWMIEQVIWEGPLEQTTKK